MNHGVPDFSLIDVGLHMSIEFTSFTGLLRIAIKARQPFRTYETRILAVVS